VEYTRWAGRHSVAHLLLNRKISGVVFLNFTIHTYSQEITSLSYFSYSKLLFYQYSIIATTNTDMNKTSRSGGGFCECLLYTWNNYIPGEGVLRRNFFHAGVRAECVLQRGIILSSSTCAGTVLYCQITRDKKVSRRLIEAGSQNNSSFVGKHLPPGHLDFMYRGCGYYNSCMLW